MGRCEDCVFDRDKALDDHIKNARPEQVHVDADLFKVLAKCRETPLEPYVVILQVLALNEVFAPLVDRVVCQMHKHVALGPLLHVFLCCKAS